MISSFLGCDRISRTSGGRPHDLGGAVELLEGDAVRVRFASSPWAADVIVRGSSVIASQNSIEHDHMSTLRLQAGPRAHRARDRGRGARGVGVRDRHHRANLPGAPRAGERRAPPDRRDGLRPHPHGSAAGRHRRRAAAAGGRRDGRWRRWRATSSSCWSTRRAAGVPVEALAADAKRLLREPIDLARARRRRRGAGRREPASIARRRGCRTRPGCSRCSSRTTGAAEATALAEAMNQRAPMAVRVNTARIARDDADRAARPRSTSSRARRRCRRSGWCSRRGSTRSGCRRSATGCSR